MRALRFLIVVAALAAAPLFLHGHVEQRINTSGGVVALSWPQGATITYRINNQTGPGLPNMTAGSNPSTAIDNAFSTIGAASGLNFVNGGTTSVTSVGTDGINLVTFANTATNVAAVGGATAIAVISFSTTTGTISEADILFNPATSFSTTGSATEQDVESVALHEGGHSVGQNHSPHTHATMFPFGAAGRTNLRTLSEDDRAGLRTLYPGATGALFGTVTGLVQRSPTQPVFGAHVALQNAITGQATTGGVTFADGTFTIEGVLPGVYNVYVEPLDGPFPAGSLGGGIWNSANFDTTFRTTVVGGTATPLVIGVTLGATKNVGVITVGGPAPTLNVTAAGLSNSPNGFSSLGGISAPLTPPYTQFFVVAGPGLNTLPDSAFSLDGPFCSITGASTFSGISGSVGFKLFPISVDAATPPGGYTVRVQNAGEVAFMTGVIDVLPAAIPLPYTQPYLVACNGSTGPVTLSANGVPAIGNGAFSLTASGTQGGQLGYLFISLLPDSLTLFTGCRIGVDLTNLVFPFPGLTFALSAASTTLPTPIPNDPGLAGVDLFVQFIAADPGAAPFGIGVSNGVAVHLQ